MLGTPGATWSAFPWKLLGPMFAKKKVTVHNWPEAIPMPPMAVPRGVTPSKAKTTERMSGLKVKMANAKSIRHLPRDVLDALAGAIIDPNYPLYFKYADDGTSGESFLSPSCRAINLSQFSTA